MSDIKEVRKQLRKLMTEVLPEVLTSALVDAINKKVQKDTNDRLDNMEKYIKEKMERMENTHKDVLGYLVRQVTVEKKQ